MLEHLPADLRGEDESGTGTASFAAALFEGDGNELSVFSVAMAERDGPLVTIFALSSQEIDSGRFYPLEFLLSEQCISVNTAAAGGNATLMSIG